MMPKKAAEKKQLTKEQKKRIIEKFRAEMKKREVILEEEGQKQIMEIKRELDGRLKYTLRKFWDFKVGDVLNYEREMRREGGEEGVRMEKVVEDLESGKGRDEY
ncbi:hypothetical protein BRETT_002775 [Brettanomyces bruxellensis]|uniref:Uncharacterized protein n=1 Tax=Dekkera bruxellensis TaxID=5007 RepID=A0A871R7X8_DEKBR|nr:uncharacterized protein BRETT_002775 [Brettanomyces bruxellensis]QOU22593.1 hypothetical protein BRETT_002775 [Brettanomyces bruxellensis]